MNQLLIIHFVIQLIFAAVYLLWQFEILFSFDEETVTHIIMGLDVFETIILVLTRFLTPTGIGVYMLGGFFIMQIIILTLQFVLANLGISVKIKSLFWIIVYMLLFANDILGINILIRMINSITVKEIDIFLKNSWFGSILSSTILAAFKIIFTYWMKKEIE